MHCQQVKGFSLVILLLLLLLSFPSTTLLAVHHYWVSARVGNSGVLPLASLLSQRVTLDFLMIENRKKFFTLLQHLDLFLGLRSSLLVASLLLHPSQRMVLRWWPSYLKRALLSPFEGVKNAASAL